MLLGETHDDSIAHQLQLQLMLGALKHFKRCVHSYLPESDIH